jgi:acyl-CoA dehydrogenase
VRYKEHQNFIDSLRKFLAKEVIPQVDNWEEKGDFPSEIFRTLGSAGYLGLLIKEESGGIGGDYELAAAWCETFGEVPSVGFTVGVNMHSLVVAHALDRFASKEQKARWLTPAISGEKIGAYAFTEPSAGSDLASLRTTAKRDGDSWVINGAKTFITNGCRADFVLLLCKTDPTKGYNGFTTFIVDTKTPGFSVNKRLKKLGWLASDTAELTLENVRVSDKDILGVEGQGWIQSSQSLSWERLMLTLTALGGARECLKETIQYCKDRVAFGKRLIDMDLIQEILIDMKRVILDGEILCDKALKLFQEGQDPRVMCAAVKRLVCDELVELADKAIQLHGGYGYTTEYPPERWWRDLRLMPIGGGTREILGNLVAKHLFDRK